MPISRSTLPIVSAMLLALALPATAESFRVVFGGKTLGTVEQGPAVIDMRIAGTPLGVFDGTFTARLAREGEALSYTARSDSAREHRVVAIRSTGGRVVETAVEPASEATALSQAAAAPAGALDPVRAFERLATAGGCPEAFRIYDGRRVSVIAPQQAEQREDGLVICRARYQVAEGPGHAGPLGLRNARLDLYYAPGGSLTEIRAKAGPFSLQLLP